MNTALNLLNVMTTKLWPSKSQVSLITPWVFSPSGIKLASDCDQPILLERNTAYLIIPRQFLFYQYIDLQSVPRALQASVIQQRLLQVSPFMQSAHWVVRGVHNAQIWFWDADLVAQQLLTGGHAKLTSIPEALLRSPLKEGFYLQPAINGWEMQHWVESSLKSSRWLPQKPSESQCADFVRISGLSSDSCKWLQSDSAWLARPWSEKAFWSKENFTSEPIVLRLIGGILVAWLMLMLGLGAGASIQEQILTVRVEEKTSEILDVVNQRDNAMRKQEFNQLIAALVESPGPLNLAAEVQTCLSAFTYVILDWQYQRDQLSLLLQQEGLDTRALIEACNKQAMFTDIRAEPGITPEQTRLIFTLSATASTDSIASAAAGGEGV